MLVAVFALAACDSGSSSSSGGSPPSGPAGFDPKTAAAKLRALGSIRIEGRGSWGTESGPVVGTIAYDPYLYRIRVAISVSQALGQATIVRVGDAIWIKRDVLRRTDRMIPLGLGTIMFRGSSSPPYFPITHPDQPFSSYLTYPFDPARLLDRIARTKAHFTADGSSAVAGTSYRRYRAQLSVPDARLIGVRSLTVWVDAKGVPVQLRLPTATAEGVVHYTVRPFAGKVSVAPPPAGAVEVVDRPLPDATAPYTEVLATTAGATPIRIFTAPADLGWTCWKVESDPPFQGLSDTRPSGGSCAPPVTPGGQSDDLFALPLVSSADLAYELLGFVVPPGSTVEFHRFGAAPVTVTAGPAGLAVFAGPADQVVGLAVISTPTAKLVCGPPNIDNLADFTAMERSAKPVDGIRGQPWNCLTEDLANLLSK